MRTILKIGIGIVLVAFVFSCGKNESDQEKPATPKTKASTVNAAQPTTRSSSNIRLQSVLQIMTTGQFASHAQLRGTESTPSGFPILVYEIRYPSPSMTSVVYSDRGRRGIITKEIVEHELVVDFDYVDDIMVTYNGQKFSLKFFDIPGRITIREYNPANQSSGTILEQLTFVGDTNTDLRYRRASGQEIRFSQNYFDRVPIP